MPKNKKHKLNCPEEFHPICKEILRGVPLRVLFGRHGKTPGQKKFLNVALAAISTLDPKCYKRLMYPPKTTHRILADSCLRTRALEAVHKNLGPVSFVPFIGKLSKHAPDPKVFDFATDNNFSAIVTYDGKYKEKTDLCSYANDQYAVNASRERPYKLPGVIVLTSEYEVTELRNNSQAMFSYLDGRPDHVLDLRNPSNSKKRQDRHKPKLPSQPQASHASVSPP